jgi:hypothetical protein
MTKKRDKPLHLDMSFDEALKRAAQTDPRELPKPKKAKKKRLASRGSIASKSGEAQAEQSQAPRRK